MYGSRFWLAGEHESLPQSANRPGVVRIQGNRRLILCQRFGLAILLRAKQPHCRMRHGPVRIAFYRFDQQLFSALFIGLNSAAEATPDSGG